MSAADSGMRGFAVCQAAPTDIDAIVALERATEFTPQWPRAMYSEIVRFGNSDTEHHGVRTYCVVAKREDGRLIGFAVGSVHTALADSAVLESLGVAPAARRGGVGRVLCEAVIEWCRKRSATEIGLEVRRQSAGAIALYARLGFVDVGVRRGYYANPQDDAVVMKLVLTGS